MLRELGLITQYKCTFLESSVFFSFIWYQIRLNMVKSKVGNDLNNMKSMERKLNSNPLPW